MPNWVENRVIIPKTKKSTKVLCTYQCDDDDFGSLDFDIMIPMPDSLNIEASENTDAAFELYKKFVKNVLFAKAFDLSISDKEKQYLKKHPDIKKEFFELGKTAFFNMAKYGASTWCKWCIDNWGVKWNAQDFAINESSADESTPCYILWFNTANAEPEPIIKFLSAKLPDHKIEHTFADSTDIGNCCGERHYRRGNLVWEREFKDKEDAAAFVYDYLGLEPEDYEGDDEDDLLAGDILRDANDL